LRYSESIDISLPLLLNFESAQIVVVPKVGSPFRIDGKQTA